MVNWFNANKLSLNLNKTGTMKFWTGTANFELKVNGQCLPLVSKTKFLGLLIDNNLTWHSHVNHLIEKLNTNRRLLSLGKNVLDKYSLRSIYFGHINSHLRYGIHVWGSMASVPQLNKLRKVQLQCVHSISKISPPTTDEYVQSIGNLKS